MTKLLGIFDLLECACIARTYFLAKVRKVSWLGCYMLRCVCGLSCGDGSTCQCIPWNPPVLIILMIESAPPDARRGIEVAAGHAASARVPSSYFLRCAVTSCSNWNVRISQTRTAPSWPPDAIKFG